MISTLKGLQSFLERVYTLNLQIIYESCAKCHSIDTKCFHYWSSERREKSCRIWELGPLSHGSQVSKSDRWSDGME